MNRQRKHDNENKLLQKKKKKENRRFRKPETPVKFNFNWGEKKSK